MYVSTMPNNVYRDVKLFSFTDNVIDFAPFIPYMRRYSQPSTIIDSIPGKAEDRSSKVEVIFGLYKDVLNDMIKLGCIKRAEKTTYSTGVFPGPLYNFPIKNVFTVDVSKDHRPTPNVVSDILFNALINKMHSIVDWMIENRQKLV